MHTRIPPTILACVLTLASGAWMGSARADVTVVVDEDGQKKSMILTPVYIAFDVGTPTETHYDVQAKVLRTVQHSDQTYQEMSESDMEEMGEQMGAQMGGAMKQLEAAMADMTDEQKKMVQQHMGAAMDPSKMGAQMSAPAKTKTYEKMNKSEKINGVDCQGYREIENGTPAGEVWAASPKAAGIPQEDLEGFGAMFDFFRSGLAKFGMEQSFSPELFDPKHEDFIGIPMKTVEYGPDGKSASVTMIVSVEKGADQESLKAWKGYTKKEGMLGGR